VITHFMNKDDELRAFAVRLNGLCDDMGIPPKGQSRQVTMGRIFGVSQKGARKWLEAESFPALSKCIMITKWAEVSFDWLMTGRPPQRLVAHAAHLKNGAFPPPPSVAAERASAAPLLSAREQVMLDLFKAFSKSEQDALIRALEEKKRQNALFCEELSALTASRK